MDKEKPQRGGGSSAMKKRKLNYRFHNPNSAEATADYILKVFIEANSEKVEKAIQEAAEIEEERTKETVRFDKKILYNCVRKYCNLLPCFMSNFWIKLVIESS